MKTEIITSIEDGVIIAAASNSDDDYIMWQKTETEPNEIYFEYNDQINSGYNVVDECSLDEGGCHLVLDNGELVHFYWNPSRHKDLDRFISQLKVIYCENKKVISDLR